MAAAATATAPAAPWLRVLFKHKNKVWAHVKQQPTPEQPDLDLDLNERGLASIRYNMNKDAQIYTVNPDNLSLLLAEEYKEKKSPAVAAAADDGEEPAAAAAGGSEKDADIRAQVKAHLARDVLVCFTDGSAKPNPGLAGAALLALYPSGATEERTYSYSFNTNNVAELKAIDLVLDLVEDKAWLGEVAIYTDSRYAKGVLTDEYQVTSNADFIARMQRRMTDLGMTRFHFHWVRAHVDITYNCTVDELAKRAASVHVKKAAGAEKRKRASVSSSTRKRTTKGKKDAASSSSEN